MQTARFSRVVAVAGRPEPYLSWMPPDKDPALGKLVRQARILTIHQELRGARRDFGTVGLLRDRHGQILVFPKSLAAFTDRKIVGIDYGLVAPGNYGAGAKMKPMPAAPTKAPPARAIPAPSSTAGAEHPVRPATPRAGAALHRKSASAAPPIRSAGRRPAEPDRALLRGIRRALTDLKAGRAVRAYATLQALLNQAQS